MSSYTVPDNLEVILSHADSTDIVDRIHAGVFLKEKKEKFFIEKNSGANAFELYARGLSVAFENDQQRGLSIALENDQNSWIWTSEGDTDAVEVVEAVKVHKLEVKKNFPICMLTRRTSYRVLFILKKKNDNEGLDKPVKLKLLLPNQEPVECSQNLSSINENKWTEIVVGDFITPCDHMFGDVEISMAQTDSEYMMKGLVVNKILICPIKKDWKELSGEYQWDSLLDPLNVDLGKILTGYGERLDAIYDCIITDVNSPRGERPMYEEKDFFSRVGPDKGKAMKCQIYEVKKYVYAWVSASFPFKSSSRNKRTWIGYVAVATDEGMRLLGRRDILVCWRGTYNTAEWKKNINFWLTPAQVIYPTVRKAKVHSGFYSIYTSLKDGESSARDEVIDEVQHLINLYQDEEVSVTITGYSLGAGLATLNAADIVSNEYNKPNPNPKNKEFLVTAFVFGSPKVGDIAFQTEFNKHILERKLHLLRIENVKDVITGIPLGSYVKVGNEITFTRTSATSYEYGKVGVDHKLKNYIREIRALPCSSRKAS